MLCVLSFLCITFSLCDTLFRVCVTSFCGETSRNSSISKESIILSAECLRITRIWLNSLSAFCRFPILFWNFCGGGNAINPHTWFLSQSSSQYWEYDFLLNSYDTSQESFCQKSVCTSFLLDSPCSRIKRTWRWEYHRSVFCAYVIQ